jgi:GT2 family glycosyltransferase
MSRTAVVILNYNGEKLLPQFLPSVIQHSDKAEIIVADNNSTDQSISLLKQTFPQVRIIQLDHNYGYCGGYNHALKQVEADYYVLLNSDIEVTANWLRPMESLLDKHYSIAAVQPKVLSYYHKSKFEHAGAGGGYIDSLGYPFCRGRIFDYVEEDLGQYNDEREIFWATGACFMIRSELFHSFGGFDEDFFAHMEEIDLCWKLHRADKKVFYCGKSTIYHLGAGTLNYRHPRKTYLNFRNGMSLVFKHFSTPEMLYKFPIRIVLDWVAAFHFLLKGQPGNFFAIMKAHLSFIGQIRRDFKKRSHLHREFPTYSKASIYPGSIIYDYYVRGKRKVGSS